MWAIIGTWRMSLEGIESVIDKEKGIEDSTLAVEESIKEIEDFPYFKSVGYGGLPNEEMEVELDAGYMDGTSMEFGAVGAVKDFANPISIAKRLSKENTNCYLVGTGAEKFASREGFERKTMLTDRAKTHYHNRLVEDNRQSKERELKPYIGHDTVGIVSLDTEGKITVGTSTSGLFMKRPGRLGDSPVIGSGFYADSEVGGATATGLGEDIMKGLVSYEIVKNIEKGMHPQEACDKAVWDLHDKLVERRGEAGDISVVAINKDGEFGVATNIEGFSFVVASENHPTTVYVTKIDNKKTTYEEASQEWLDDYIKTRTSPLNRL